MARTIIISKSKIIAVMLYIITFLSFNIDYFPGFQFIKYACIVVIAFYLLFNYKSFITWQNFKINNAILLFSVCVLLASFLNIDTLTTRNSFLSAIVFIAIITETFFFMQIMGKTGKMNLILNLYLKLTFVWVMIVDGLILLNDSLSIQYKSYIVGTKFEVCYLHMILLSLFFYRIKYCRYAKWKSMIIIAFLCFLSIFMAIRIDCITGLLGIIMTLFLQVNVFGLQRILTNSNIFIIALFLPIVFVICYEAILSNDIIQNIIISIFNRNLTLTGRTKIYEALPHVLSGHYLFGYGYGSTYEICRRKIGYADTQNALLEWVMQIGIPGTILLVLLCYYVIRKNYESRNTNTYPFIILIFVFIILGMVEITMGLFFICLMAVINGCSIECKNSPQKERSSDNHESKYNG